MKITKIPVINGLEKTKGCENAPERIIEKLKEIYTNEQGKEIKLKELNIQEINLKELNIEEKNKRIYDFAFNELKNSKEKLMFLGGDHSISYPLTKAFFDFTLNKDSEKKQPCLIIFDAHPDLMSPIDSEIPTHEEWLNSLIKKGFPTENILLIGLRNSDISELKIIKKHNIKVINLDNFIENDFSEVCDSIMEFANNKNLYLSIDIDVIDPVFAPATGYTEVGGLTSREFLFLIKRINKMKNLRVVDLVEINSEKDKKHDFITTKLGAKILSEFLW